MWLKFSSMGVFLMCQTMIMYFVGDYFHSKKGILTELTCLSLDQVSQEIAVLATR